MALQKTTLSTADVARLFNVTETTVKRWADEGTLKCQRTPGGHRKFIIRYVVEFAEKNNIEPVGVLRMPGEGERAPGIQMAVLEKDFPALVRTYIEKALSPDRYDLVEFFSYLYEHKVQLCELYDNVIRPGMAEIGDHWERGILTVDKEHRASYETLDAVAKLQLHVRIKPSTGRSVICACLGDEMHEIGLRCAAYLFESEGWRTLYLGARTPLAALTSSLLEVKPDVLCLSTAAPTGETLLQEGLEEAVRLARTLRAQVVLGGSGAAARRLPEGLVDHICTSAKDLMAFIESASRQAGATALTRF